MTSLIFVYNAKSGKLSALLDAGHKLLSPNTYQCNLCTLTFDAFSENKQWKQFREKSKINMTFYHLDEFEAIYKNQKFQYPIVLKQQKGHFDIILNKQLLNQLRSADELINLLRMVHMDNQQSNL